jgi:hypothetical protein
MSGQHLVVFFLFVFLGPMVGPVKLQRLQADHLKIRITMRAGDFLTQENMRVESNSTFAFRTICTSHDPISSHFPTTALPPRPWKSVKLIFVQ